ncbi:GNAT family N-acetyltransferase [Methanospirillum sp.]|uniref:GNAT family N-acetyltransferase n=1 Tax=Methanospirillum sp. TaxID=45200 RepID=UPI002987DB50|nr:GNAT family N-acetyltransferase [Methanospirillum sp.]
MEKLHVIRNLKEDEIYVPIEWARLEGWNPGLHDGACHYPVDPEGWFCAEHEGEIIGVGVATNYDETFSFGGFYIVKKQYRHQGAGWEIFSAMLTHAGERNFGGDGVFEMQDKYTKAVGLQFAYRNIRWQGIADGNEQHDLLPAKDIPFNQLLIYDSDHFPVTRQTFLEKWISQPESSALVKLDNHENIRGYGVIRRCFEGYKTGPLFAESPEIADEIFEGLMAQIPGETIFLDTPEPNEAALRMARNKSMAKVFGTARMYTKKNPQLPIHEIFGVTTFELG